ncbi:MAG: SusE domain-containing protein [Lewinellaceae bacterium]|nr:SusE domain-containing protein [Lewinellaceae bacterium]
MKKYNFLTLATLVLFALSCGKGEFFPGPTLYLGDTPVITSPANTDVLVLTENQANDPFKVTWTAAEYGFTAATTYIVEADRAGNNFANAVEVGRSTKLELNSTVSKLNTVLFSTLGLQGEVASDIEMRLVAKVSDEVPLVYSPSVALRVTPYTIVVVYPKLGVPGNYQGWNEKDETTVVYSVKSDNKYEGYLYFANPDGEYKYVENFSWDVNYGDTGANGTLDAGGDNIKLTAAGMYRLNADLNALTHTFALTNWGIIGDATPTGWDSDTDMIYDAIDRKLTITMDLIGGNKIKFRANDDWPVNLGDNDANGSLEYGGADIVVPESGNYTIDLILSGAIYTYKLTKN